jgi:hypothetical protein
MDNDVLESTPAFERLVERLGAKGEPPPSEESWSGHAKRFRPGRRSTVQASDPEVLRERRSADGARAPGELATVAEPATIVEEEPEVGEDDADYEDPRPSDEMILVDVDEEPRVFDEDPEDYDEEDEADDSDAVLDFCGGEEPDGEDETADEHKEVFDEEDEVLDGYKAEDVSDEVPVEVAGASEGDVLDNERFVDEVVDWILIALEERKLEAVEDDAVQEENVVVDEDEGEDVDVEVPVEVVGVSEDDEADDEEIVGEDRELVDQGAEALDENEHEGDNGILDVFEDWNLEAIDGDTVDEEEDLEAFDEDDADDDEFIDVFDEDTDDPVEVPEPPCERCDVPVALLELPVELYEPHNSTLSALSSQLSAQAGRKKARHKKQSPRQRKRFLKKVEQDARKAEKASRKAAAKSSMTTALPSSR